MRSVRFDVELDVPIQRAAEVDGIWVSGFLRVAVAERSQRTLSEKARDRLGNVLGVVHAGGAGPDRPG